jgi:hypothetical protein
MIRSRGLWLYFFLFLIIPIHCVMALELANADEQATLFITTKNAAARCSKSSLQNCVVLISQNLPQCIARPGSIIITNNSNIPAKNIQVSSLNSFFIYYVIQNNACPASLAPGSSCSISFATNTSIAFFAPDILVKGTNTNAAYFDIQSLDCPPGATILSVSISDLALSVAGLTEFGVPGTPASGVPRIITITNIGTNPAINLSVIAPAWPAGTISSTTCTSTLAAGNSCTVTIAPGNTATSDGLNPCSTSATAPIPQVVQVTASNSNTVSTNVVILSYGCIYQGGYVFAFNDTTANIGNVGGKVAATTDQAAPFPNGIIWASNGGTGGVGPFDTPNTSLDIIPGIDELSTSSTGSPTYATFATFFSSTYVNPNPFTPASFAMCNGMSDGSCNTGNILTFYNQFITNNTLAIGGSPPFLASPGPTPITFYSAGLCKQTIAGFSDWYLPAICELGFGGSVCGTSVTPTAQNMQSSLVDFNSLNLLAGLYWASTVPSSLAQVDGWGQLFASGGGSSQSGPSKPARAGVRCARAF